MINWIYEPILSFLGSLSYGIMFQVPRKTLLPGGLIGMAGWLLFRTLKIVGISEGGATLFAAFLVASLSGWFAILLKVPSTTLSISGIIPLVPGALAYRTMLSFVEENYQDGLILGIRTMMVAGAIASGMILSLSLFKMRREWRARFGRTRV